MTRIASFLLLSAALLRADWTLHSYGALEVLSSGNDKESREALNYLEQLRHTTAFLLGIQELELVWPMRFVVIDPKKVKSYPEFRLGRDAFLASAGELGPATAGSAAKLMLESWTGHIPPRIARGMVSLLSTLDVAATRVTLGTPPAQKDRDWARMHLMSVHPDYSGKLRVLIGNLAKGVDPEVAYRNAFEKTADQVERELDKYIEAGSYGTIPVSGRPVNAQRQFYAKEISDSQGSIYLADVLLANDAPEAKAAYQAVLKRQSESIEAREGLGLLSKDLTLLQAARSARALAARAELEEDPSQKKLSLNAAIKANPRWAEPHKRLANLETHPAQKLAALRKATELSPGDVALWILLAQTEEAANLFAQAGRSWNAAERATDDLNVRSQIRASRTAGEEARVQQQIAERLEVRRKAEQEINDLRNRALREIREAEARANEGKPVIDAKTLERYGSAPETTRVEGRLERVDCISEGLRLQIGSGRSISRVLIVDPAKVEIAGGGERNIACGAQRPVKTVIVDYVPKRNSKLGTIGEAAKIAFR